MLGPWSSPCWVRVVGVERDGQRGAVGGVQSRRVESSDVRVELLVLGLLMLVMAWSVPINDDVDILMLLFVLGCLVVLCGSLGSVGAQASAPLASTIG